jgi:DNA-binding CsgD family transcriptional regulator
LNGQQQRIFKLLGQGLTNTEIARQLGISVRTLESYCVRITDKLSLQGIKELRRLAIHHSSGSTLL